jgi:hypothetical protein
LKIYHVSSNIGQVKNICEDDVGAKHHLLPYFALYNSPAALKFIAKRKDLDFFLDSGAYSIFNGKEKGTLERFIIFCHRFGKIFKAVAAFDVIDSADKSLENYNDMIRAGIDYAIPTWHADEDISYLEEYCRRTDYIAIGGLMANATIKNMSLKPEIITKRIAKGIQTIKKYDSKIKVHLFAVTSPRLMTLFHKDVYSVDSSSYTAAGHYGRAYCIGGAHRTFDYPWRWKCGYGTIQRYNVSRMLILEQMLNESKSQSKNKDA